MYPTTSAGVPARRLVIERRLATIRRELARIKGHPAAVANQARQLQMIQNMEAVEQQLRTEDALLGQYRTALAQRERLQQQLNGSEQGYRHTPADRQAAFLANRLQPARNAVAAQDLVLQGLQQQITQAQNYPQLDGNAVVEATFEPCVLTAGAAFRAAVPAAHQYPPDNPLVLAIAAQAKAALAAATDPSVQSGFSIGVALLANGTVLLSTSGQAGYAQTRMNLIQAGLPAGTVVQQSVAVVPTLNLNPPLHELVVPPDRHCAMPKLFYSAQQAGSPVVHVCEIWWDVNGTVANPYPEAGNPHFMYPCEFCNTNCQRVLNYTAW